MIYFHAILSHNDILLLTTLEFASSKLFWNQYISQRNEFLKKLFHLSMKKWLGLAMWNYIRQLVYSKSQSDGENSNETLPSGVSLSNIN